MSEPDFTECDKTASCWDQWSTEDCRRMAAAYHALRAALGGDTDIIARHSGKTSHREWWSGGEWLYPGDEIVKRDASHAAAPKPSSPINENGPASHTVTQDAPAPEGTRSAKPAAQDWKDQNIRRESHDPRAEA